MDSDPFDFQIDPSTDNYAVMGNPVAHSKSPQIHQYFARQTNQVISYQSILVPAGKFTETMLEFGRLGGKGLNITVPFKQDAWNAVSVRTARAETAGAVNTISFKENGDIEGDNTDGTGLLRDLERNNIQVKGARILILGAGGAIRGVLGPLLEQSPGSVLIANRTPAKADMLVSSHAYFLHLKACRMSDLPDAGSFDLIINGTSAGLQGELPPVPVSLITRQSCCYDMVYGDREPVFVEWAKTQGARIAIDGLGMLVEQAAESFSIWRGVRPDVVPVIKMLRNEVRRGK